MAYEVAIPSHRRAVRLAETVAWLRDTTVPLDRVSVFLSDKEDARAYAGCGLRSVVTGASNVTEKFNAIHDHYKPGTRVFVLEDDVTVVVADGAGKPTPARDLSSIVEAGFASLPGEGLWGIVPHSNPFYFGGKVTTSLKLVVAHAYGFVATRDPSLHVTQIGKSDYERTILYWNRYGMVVRVDVAGCLTKSYTALGGMQCDLKRGERAAAEEAACAYLVARYPHLISRNLKKKSLFGELTFRRMEAQDPAALQAFQANLDRDRGYARS